MSPEPTIDDVPAGYDNQEASAWIMGFEHAVGLMDDMRHDLCERRKDCAKVREHLVPLLKDVPPYDEDITGDTDRLRAGFVARIAADRIEDQAHEIERLRAKIRKDRTL